jgi:predicted AAA+ superfamily ATPase
MKRDKINELHNWKNSQYRKPLILTGARQVGKTWLLKAFGIEYYKQVVYINFEDQISLKNLFLIDFNIVRIIKALEIFSGIKIDANDTLIIFDEIQTAENGITSLKYFYENAPEYHLIAAGSMLGIAHHKGSSFPVGKVDFLDLMPMTFIEFLNAHDEEQLGEAILNSDWSLLQIFHVKLLELLKVYMYVGGMPEVVSIYIESSDFQIVRKTQINLLNAYQSDFAKYAPLEIVPRLNMVWRSIPAQLAKENKKFVYNILKEGARAKDFEIAIQWLTDCGLLLKTNRIKTPKMPLTAYEEWTVFKLFLVDVGLLGALSQLSNQTIIEGNRIFEEFKGALAEQFVRQQLSAKDFFIGYWTNENSSAEVDFLLQKSDNIIAIEVKSGENVRSKSFSEFYKKYQLGAIRFSLLPYQHQGWMENIPLYAVGSI